MYAHTRALTQLGARAQQQQHSMSNAHSTLVDVIRFARATRTKLHRPDTQNNGALLYASNACRCPGKGARATQRIHEDSVEHIVVHNCMH